MMKRLEKARKKAEALEGEEGDGVSEKEKWQQIKRYRSDCKHSLKNFL